MRSAIIGYRFPNFVNILSKNDFINLDLSKSSSLDIIPKSVTHVFHCAAQSSGEVSFENPRYDVLTNAVATLDLLDWSLKNSVKKFIFTSSMNVYGEVPKIHIDENQITAPESFYGIAKVASENYCKIFSDMGLNCTVLRLFNTFGPGQNMNNMKQGMLSIYISYLLQDKPILVKGSLNRFRDFVYIEDVISSIIKVIDYQESFDIFNVCSGKRFCKRCNRHYFESI